MTQHYTLPSVLTEVAKNGGFQPMDKMDYEAFAGVEGEGYICYFSADVTVVMDHGPETIIQVIGADGCMAAAWSVTEMEV